MKSDLNSNKKSDIFELLFNSMPFTYIFWKNRQGIYMGANSNQIAMFGHNGKDFIGKTIYEVLNDYESAKLIDDIDTKIMCDGVPVTIEEPVTTPQGEQRVFLSQKQPIRNYNNEIIGLLGFSLDITERKKMEDDLRHSKELAEAANKAKTEFLENMRHDIRTPLTGIVGFADILRMEADSPHLKEYADNLIASSYALLDLLDEVLEAIRVSSGEIPKLKKKFNLRKTLQGIIELTRAKAAQKKIELTLNFDSNIPSYLIGDKVRVHRIILELVANALNFTDAGFVKLSALLSKRNHRELIIKLIVEDSGIGIPKDKQQEIYVQFKRLTPSYQGIYKGAGLGLSVVKQFVDELEGEIYVESELRKGSRFTCIIPLQESLLDEALGIDEEIDSLVDHPYERTFAQEIKPISPALEQKQHRILVVEDNTIAQTIAKSLLNTLNCNVDIADSGKKGIEQWRTGQYDLIFMDIGLPDMNGYEVTHLIRIQELPKKSHIPIIALTAHAGDENKKRCIDAGMNAVITKPLTARNCTDIIDTFIPGRKKDEDTQALPVLSGTWEENSSLFDLTEYPILDIEEGIRTTGDKNMLAEMLTIMVDESLPGDLELLIQTHDANNWDKTQQIAHKIKSGAVYVGTVKVKMACQYFEQYWKSGQRELLEKLYQQVIATIHESLEEIRKWLTTNK
ncbi:response regulator [Legionella cardiaca]|uniref:histidine kinase n=1 Tax=Legionella cardiaca TaxID=1071983 RepID=A0ABY8ASP5_9GAMM|nr:response regulator [Legionella cardiaca]WED43699.1 response regulator [Legionella cardiaca]